MEGLSIGGRAGFSREPNSCAGRKAEACAFYVEVPNRLLLCKTDWASPQDKRITTPLSTYPEARRVSPLRQAAISEKLEGFNVRDELRGIR